MGQARLAWADLRFWTMGPMRMACFHLQILSKFEGGKRRSQKFRPAFKIGSDIR